MKNFWLNLSLSSSSSSLLLSIVDCRLSGVESSRVEHAMEPIGQSERSGGCRCELEAESRTKRERASRSMHS